jgi:hypothetical protein
LVHLKKHANMQHEEHRYQARGPRSSRTIATSTAAALPISPGARPAAPLQPQRSTATLMAGLASLQHLALMLKFWSK